MIRSNPHENDGTGRDDPPFNTNHLTVRPARPGDEPEVLRLYTHSIPPGLVNTHDNAIDMRHLAMVYFDPDAIGRLWVAEAGTGGAGEPGVVPRILPKAGALPGAGAGAGGWSP